MPENFPITENPFSFLIRAVFSDISRRSSPFSFFKTDKVTVRSRQNDQPLLAISLLLVDIVNPLSGGYCVGVPPLPIPNREVKPDCADGTAMQCGRVGGRLLFLVLKFMSRKPTGVTSGAFFLRPCRRCAIVPCARKTPYI